MIELETLTIESWPFKPLGIAYGQGKRLQLEVLYSEHDRTPSPTQLRSAWKARQDRRGVPLLVVVLHAEKAHDHHKISDIIAEEISSTADIVAILAIDKYLDEKQSEFIPLIEKIKENI